VSPSGSKEPLAAWLYGTHVANLAPAGASGDQVNLTWTADAADRWGLGSRVVSNLLPIGRGGARPHSRAVTAYLQGLLAEGNLREHLAFEASITPDDVFGMVSAYGRDTAGALVFLPPGAGPESRVGVLEPMTNADIAARLRAAGTYTPGRLESTSLAGLQPKIVLQRTRDRWYRCLQGAPSTHIIKLGTEPDAVLGDVIDTEAACIALATLVGLSTISAEVTHFEGVRALVISRYDRIITADGQVRRVHQEDTAQALGLDTRDMNRKFQRGKNLPSLKAIAAVLRNSGQEPDPLLALTAFNLAIGNSDAHAKNISLLRPQDGSCSLAPAYDVAMHAHHRTFGNVFAMDVNGRRVMTTLTGADLLAEARAWPLPERRARRVVHETLAALESAIQDIDRDLHPGVQERAWTVVKTRTKDLLATLESTST
jgi:serine/threonine-protein kinase HipA